MKKESPLVKFYRQDATQSVIASMISIAIGLALGKSPCFNSCKFKLHKNTFT